MPYMVGLWEAMEQEERRAIPGLDAVDVDIGGSVNGDVELGEALEHFDNLMLAGLFKQY
jgi:hypothetical protein